jgi:hypothetical protein
MNITKCQSRHFNYEPHLRARGDLQEDFAAFWEKDFQSHVINDKEVGFEVFVEQTALHGLGFLGEQLAHQIEDRAVKDDKAGLERGATNRPDQIDPARALAVQ